ncbi:MAG: glycosyltransferase family 1 protein [Pseudomonadota bacterium]
MAVGRRVLLDVTRSLSRLAVARPSGIDRVEHAYLDWAISRDGLFLVKIGQSNFLLSSEGAAALRRLILGEDEALDVKARLRPDRNLRVRMGESLVRRLAIGKGNLQELAKKADVYLNVGHALPNERSMDAISALKRLVMIHDLIPLTHPEYSSVKGPEQARTRLRRAHHADHLMVNTEHTGYCVVQSASELGLKPKPVSKIALGIDVPPRPDISAGDHFVYLSTIEPRKNHSLLLDIWQRDWPKLHFIGRRGWQNRDVFRRLDKPPANIVEEHGLSDARVWLRLASARALLFPSHVEGYGLPLAEALSFRTPVIASDLPAFREIAGDVPDYLDPNDRESWRKIIQDYTTGGNARASQIDRIGGWTAPRWDNHFNELERLLEDL